MNDHQRVYAVRDGKIEGFMLPFCAQNDAVATRQFADAIKEPGSPFNKHPEDYQLYLVGEYDLQNGTLTPTNEPIFVSRALDFMEGHLPPVGDGQ